MRCSFFGPLLKKHSQQKSATNYKSGLAHVNFYGMNLLFVYFFSSENRTKSDLTSEEQQWEEK